MGLFDKIKAKLVPEKIDPERGSNVIRVPGYKPGMTILDWDVRTKTQIPQPLEFVFYDSAKQALLYAQSSFSDWTTCDLSKRKRGGRSEISDYWWRAYSAGIPLSTLAAEIPRYIEQTIALSKLEVRVVESLRARYPDNPVPGG
jgi:hypothetical protein